MYSFLCGFFCLFSILSYMENDLKLVPIIHRGLIDKSVTENTLHAFMKTMNKQYIIELDVRLLKDNTVVVFHDASLQRLTKTAKNVESYNYNKLKKIKINGRYTIPTLSSVLNLVDGKVPILIDVKGNINNYQLEDALLRLLHNYQGKVYIQSLQVKSLNYMWKKQRQYSYGLIVLNSFHLKLFTKLWIKFRCDFVSCYIETIKNKYLQSIRKHKLLIGWTVTSEEDIKKYKDYCDNFICENIG